MAERGETRWLTTDRVLLAAGLLLLVWLTGDVLLLVFGGILIATGLDALACAIARRTPIPRGWALVLVALALFAFLCVTFVAIAPQFVRQVAELQSTVTDLVGRLQGWLAGMGADGMMEDQADQLSDSMNEVVAYVADWGMTALGAITSLVILVVLAVFLAADPGLYRRGVLRLVPPARRPLAHDTLVAIARALRWWFLGQLVSMVMLGTTVGLGLFVLGIELWLALAVLTALLTFIPFLGPLIAYVPILAAGFAQGLETGLIVTAGYLVIQNLEGNVVVPMIQHKAVDLAPALLIGFQLLLSLAFGVTGLILAAPIAVVLMVAVQKLYVEAVLGEPAVAS